MCEWHSIRSNDRVARIPFGQFTIARGMRQNVARGKLVFATGCLITANKERSNDTERSLIPIQYGFEQNYVFRTFFRFTLCSNTITCQAPLN